MKKYRRRERGKERTFKKKKKVKKKGSSRTPPTPPPQQHTVVHFSRGSLCVNIHIDLLGRARADVVVTTVV